MSTLIFASADVIYYKKYAKSFVKSAIAHGNMVHVHVINPEIGLQRIEHPNVSYSFEENGPNTREYYASNRFHIAPEIIMANTRDDMKLLILDIDSIIRAKVELPNAAVGLYLREPFGANDWERRGTRVAAGAVMYDSTAWLFAKRVSEKLKELPPYWFTDQVALAETMDEFKTAINIHDFSKTPLLDWEFRDEGVIWTAKGPDRKNDPRFLAELEKYS